MFKKITALLLMSLMLFSGLSVLAVNYDHESAYWECVTLYPNFIRKIKDQGVTDEQLISFLSSCKDHLISMEGTLTEENFDSCMYEALHSSFSLRKHTKVRNAFAKAYPESVESGVDGVITEEFRPIYDTVKRHIFEIKTPVITISTSLEGEKIAFFAHCVNLPENCRFTLAVYGCDGILLTSKVLTPNCEGEGIYLDSGEEYTAKLFAWEQDLSPVCPCYELSVK